MKKLLCVLLTLYLLASYIPVTMAGEDTKTVTLIGWDDLNDMENAVQSVTVNGELLSETGGSIVCEPGQELEIGITFADESYQLNAFKDDDADDVLFALRTNNGALCVSSMKVEGINIPVADFLPDGNTELTLVLASSHSLSDVSFAFTPFCADTFLTYSNDDKVQVPNPKSCISLPSNVNYTVDQALIGTYGEDFDPFEEEKKLEEGETLCIFVRLKANSLYSFPDDEDDITCTVNGYEAIVDGARLGYVDICIPFTVPAAHYVCELNGTKYTTVEGALAAEQPEDESAEKPSVLKLLDDVKACVYVQADRFIELDLNGYVLQFAENNDFSDKKIPASIVYNAGTLTITDSNTDKQTHTFTEDKNGMWVWDDTLEGEAVKHTVSGGVITGKKDHFGVMNDYNGDMTISGGTIAGNTSGEMNIVGAVQNLGKMTMTDGCITGNYSKYYGGGVTVQAGSFTMTGGSIEYNIAGVWGGGVEASGNLTITGGSIKNNTALTGGGIFYFGSGTTQAVFGGTSAVTGNKGGNLAVDSPITIDTSAGGKPTTMSVGVSLVDMSDINDDFSFNPLPGAFTTNGSESDMQYFFSDSEAFDMEYVPASGEEGTDKYVAAHLELVKAGVAMIDFGGDVGVKKYDTVKEAVNACPAETPGNANPTTIKLLCNTTDENEELSVSEELFVSEDRNIILDLNEKTLTVHGIGITGGIHNEGILTIRNGKIIGTDAGFCAVSNRGTLTIEEADIIIRNMLFAATINAQAGEVIINSGTFTAEGSQGNTGVLYSTGNEAGNIIVKGGNFIGEIIGSTSVQDSVQIYGGLFSQSVAEELLADGCRCVENTDEDTKDAYPYRVEEIPDVAQIDFGGDVGIVKYKTVQAAVNACPAETPGNENPTVIKMIADTTEPVITVAHGKNIELDLNGKNIFIRDPYPEMMINKGKLIIDDHSERKTGYIAETGDACSPNKTGIANSGTLVLNAGTLELQADCVWGIIQDGSFTMNGGSILAKGFSLVQCIRVVGAGSTLINDGIVSAYDPTPDYNNGIYSITMDNASSSVTVNGGQFTGSISKTAGTIAVYGGLFDTEVDSAFLAEDYRCVENTDEETKDAYPYKVEKIPDVAYLDVTAEAMIHTGSAYNENSISVAAKDKDGQAISGLTYVYTWYKANDLENPLASAPSDIGGYTVKVSVDPDNTDYIGTAYKDVWITPAPKDYSGAIQYKEGSGLPLVFTCNADFADFVSVTVSKNSSAAQTLAQGDDYTAEEGSVKITLLKEYCDKLDKGSYAFSIITKLPNAVTETLVETKFAVEVVGASCVETKTVAFKAGENLTLLLGGKNAGVYTIEKSGRGYILFDTEKKQYVAFDAAAKKVELSETAFVWSYANGGLYTTVTTKSSGSYWWWWSYPTNTNYYLTFNGELGTSTRVARVQVQETVEYDEHDLKYEIHGDTHDVICKRCGEKLEENVPHTYDQPGHKCVCGKVDPDYIGVTAVKVEKKQTKANFWGGWWFWGGHSKTQYTYTVKATTTFGYRVSRLQYSTDDGKYTTIYGNQFIADKELDSFYLLITDSKGTSTKWFYDGTETKKVKANQPD